MELTQDNKAFIDSLSYEELLREWRFHPIGEAPFWFEGATGEYWGKKMGELRGTVDHVAISKKIGWEK